MKANVFYESISDGYTIPSLNTRIINFESLKGLRKSFQVATAKDYGNLIRFYGTGKVIKATAICGDSEIATTKIFV